MKAQTTAASLTGAPVSPDFRPGQAVVFVDRATGAPVELATVSEVLPDPGEVLLEGWTARFSLADGRGLPLVEYEDLPSCEVVDLSGRVVRAAGAPSAVPVRRIEPRFDIRPATAEDDRFLEEREEAGRLAASLSRRLSRLARSGSPPPLRDLIAAEECLALRAAR